VSKLIHRLSSLITNPLFLMAAVTVVLNLLGNAIRWGLGVESSLILPVLQGALSVVVADRLVNGKEPWKKRWAAIIALAGENWPTLTKLAVLVTIMFIASEQSTTPTTPLVQQVYNLVSMLAPITVVIWLTVNALRIAARDGGQLMLGRQFMDLICAATAYQVVLALIGTTGDDVYFWIVAQPNEVAVFLATGLFIAVIVKIMGSSAAQAYASMVFAEEPFEKSSMAIQPPLSEQDLRYIAAHEAGHALAYAALGTIPADIRVVGHPEKGKQRALGHVTGIPTPHRLEKTEFVEWQMLVLLCGKQGEIAMFGQATLGSTNDHSRWLDYARQYLVSQNKRLFYGSPRNEFEHNYDCRQIESLLAQQQELVSDLFAMNPAAFKALYQAVLDKGTLGHDELVPILCQVNLPPKFAQPNGPVREISCVPV